METVQMTKTRNEWTAIVTELRHGTEKEREYAEKLNTALVTQEGALDASGDDAITLPPHYSPESVMVEMITTAEERIK